MCLHIRLPGLVRAECAGGYDMILLRGSTGAVEVEGSSARGANIFIWPARKSQEFSVINSSFGSSSRNVGFRDSIAVNATRGFAILVRPCSKF